MALDMKRTPLTRLLAALAAGTLLVAACGGDDGGSARDRDESDERSDESDESDRSDQSDESDRSDETDMSDESDRSDETDMSDESDRSDETDMSDESDRSDETDMSDDDGPVVVQPLTGGIDDIVVRTAVTDLHQWWTQVFDDVYPDSDYSGPVAGAWSLRPGESVECGGLIVTYDDVADNAIYAPCSQTVDGIFFDTERFIPGLVTGSGQFAGAFIAAHEWGHLIQARGREDNSVDVTQELQADCYAGAWVRHVADDGVPFTLGTNDIDVALAALIGIGDPVGIGPDTVGAHGSAFDRVSAFTAGLKDIQNCVTFQTDPPPIFEMEFTTPEEQANQGNLPLLDLLNLVELDLITFFQTEIDPSFPVPNSAAGDCDGRAVELEWCPSANAIVVNPERLQAFHDFVGDWATATLLARAYADSVGIAPQVSNCLSGAFDRALILDVNANPKTYNLQLSSGDLDESARVFLAKSMGGDGIVSVDNLRLGLLEGVPACERLAQGG